MSSRKEQKEEARAAREAKEQELAASAAKKRRLSIVGGVIGLALIAVLIAVVVSSSTDTKSTSSDAAEVNARYAGIPQKGIVLGEPNAKATIVEFADQASHDAWGRHAEHGAAQGHGRKHFYSEYKIQVCEVKRESSFVADAGGAE